MNRKVLQLTTVQQSLSARVSIARETMTADCKQSITIKRFQSITEG